MKTPENPWLRALRLLLCALTVGVTVSPVAADVCATGGLGKGRGWVVGAGSEAVPADPDPIGGMGGTGIVARAPDATGLVVGTITRFGSICVNGIEIAFDASVPVTSQGRPADTGAIGLGQVVRVVTEVRGGRAHARAIDVVAAVSGPVTARDTTAQTFAVMGRTVHMGQDSIVALAGLIVPDVGTQVTVSGVGRPDGAVVASRLAAKEAGSRAYVAGQVRDLDGEYLDVDGVTVRLPKGEQAGGYAIGDEVAASGNWLDGALHAELVSRNPPIQPAAGAPDWVSLEGFYARCDEAPDRYAVGGTQVSMPPALSGERWVGQRVVVLGVPREGAVLELAGIGVSSLATQDVAAAPVPVTGPCRRPMLADGTRP
jgi:hypothetical protein